MDNMGECEQRILINELTEGREVARQLQQYLGAPSSSYETCDLLVTKIQASYEKALSMLNYNASCSTDQPAQSSGLAIRLMSDSPPPSHSEDSDHRDFKEHELQLDAYKKRKILPRWAQQVRVTPGTPLEGPLDDGFSWRKYGQKDILGAKYPRGYYRCTHRNVQGCFARKQVQRSDEDPTIFDITYRGKHTCNEVSSHVMPLSKHTCDVASSHVMPLSKQTCDVASSHVMPLSKQTCDVASSHVMPLSKQTCDVASSHVMPLSKHTCDVASSHVMPLSKHTCDVASSHVMPLSRVSDNQKQQPQKESQDLLLSFQRELKVVTQDLGNGEQIYPSFPNYTSSTVTNENNLVFSPPLMGSNSNLSSPFISPATSGMSSDHFLGNHNFANSSEIYQAAASSTNSPTVGLDIPFGSVHQFDPNFTFDNNGFFP